MVEPLQETKETMVFLGKQCFLVRFSCSFFYEQNVDYSLINTFDQGFEDFQELALGFLRYIGSSFWFP